VTFTNTSTSPNAVPITLTRIEDVLPAGMSMVNSTYTGTSDEILNYSASVPRPTTRIP